MNWFEIDKAGLARVLERRGKAWVVLELLQNAWDQNVTTVEVSLHRPAGEKRVVVRVQDDDPQGFADLRHAFTLFAPSTKQLNPSQRGRFNLGEKLVLALCDEASIRTTRGSVHFDHDGRRRGRRKTKCGSVFEGRLKMTQVELEESLAAVRMALPPANVVTRLNGEVLPIREPMCSIRASLPTEVSGANGALIRRMRNTTLQLHEPLEGEVPSLYEMGLPIMPTHDEYHVDVQQKIPMPMDRDSVSPAYLKAARTYVLNATYDRLSDEGARRSWVREALGDARCSSEAVRRVVNARFGPRAVVFDPSDPESNSLAASQGFTVVHGGNLSKDEWANVKESQALLPAGQVTPAPKPDKPPLCVVDRAEWNSAENARVESIHQIADVLIGEPINVIIADDPEWPFNASYGDGQMTLNRAAIGTSWFEGPLTERVLSLVIHELGHHFAADHLSSDYHQALCRLGARLGLSGPWGKQGLELVRETDAPESLAAACGC